MKKIFYAFVMMAAAMVGCQNVDENVNINNESNTEGFSVVASVDNEAIDRAIISENEDGTFSPKWVSDDKDNMTLIEFVGSASNVSNPSGMSVSEDGRVATFSGFSFAASEGSSYNYVATVPMPAALGDEFILVNFADVQNDWWENPSASYDALNDMLVSQLITRDQQVAAGEQLDIKMARLNSAMKLVIKGIPASTEVSSVTFSCDQPIAGRSKIMLSDLDGVTYPVPTTLEKGVKSITKGQYFFSDSDMEMVVFLSCMPATLKAGENYTVSIECSDATKLVKKGVLRSAITLEAGEVTTIPVNMSDAATVTKVENLSEECEYAIGYTTADGVTYLLNRTATTKNPAGARISDLGLKINSNGSIEGAVPEAYVWNYSKTDKGESQFYYITNSGNRAHLVSCNKNQGIAILSLNENGVYAGHYASATMIYTDTFTMDAKEGGYYMYVGL